MVPMLSITGMSFSLLIAVALPIVLLIVLCVKTKKGLLAALVGAVCFFVSAMFLEQLLHAVVLPKIGNIPGLFVLYACLASGLFEETGRLVGLSFLCKWRHGKKDSSLATGLAYGIGHGGFEAMLLVGMATLNNLVFALMLNSGGMEGATAGFTGAELQSLETAAQQMQTIPSATFFVGGLERIAAIALHIALSLLIWMVVTKRVHFAFYFVAIFLHGLTNLGAALMQAGVWNSIAMVELYTFAVVACVWVLVLLLYRRTAAKVPVNEGV